MKTWKWAFVGVAAMVVAAFIFASCDDGSIPEAGVPETVVTSVTLDKDELGLVIGDEYTLTATALPANAVNKTLTWKSSRTVVATVDNDGKVTAKAYGETIISATAKSGKMALCVVTVGDVVTTGVTLARDTLTLEVEETFRLIPVVEPPDASNKNVSWSSDTPAVASVAANGTITAVAKGTAIITVTTHNGGFTETCTVTVENISVKGVTLESVLYLEEGDEETLIPTILPAKAFNKGVTWGSDDEDVATVDSTGKVTAVANGEAIITVTTTDGQFEDTCTVIVDPIPVDSLEMEEELYVAVGGKKNLTPIFLPVYLRDKTVTWESDDDDVATVSADGIVTGIGEGEAIITAISNKDPTKTATCTVTVNEGMLQYMVKIPAGTFTMGSPTTELGHYPDEYDPNWTNETQHPVTLSSFYMLDTPVLLVDYYAVTEEDPFEYSWFIYDYLDLLDYDYDEVAYCPADGVTWYDAVEFCNKLSEIEGFTPVYTITKRRPTTGYPIVGATVTADWTANGYRLPTEAEWEYACRGETTTPFHTGDNIIPPSGVEYDDWGYVVGVDDFGEANYDGEFPYNDNDPGEYIGIPVPPYLYGPNNYGLHSMHGNLEEWCWDWYGGDYGTTAQTNPRGPAAGEYRMLRGGSFQDPGEYVRSAMRNGLPPGATYFYGYYGVPYCGFRFVRNAPSEPDTRTVIGRSGTAKRERVIPQGFLQGKPQDKPQGKRAFDKNSASSIKLEFLRNKGVEE